MLVPGPGRGRAGGRAAGEGATVAIGRGAATGAEGATQSGGGDRQPSLSRAGLAPWGNELGGGSPQGYPQGFPGKIDGDVHGTLPAREGEDDVEDGDGWPHQDFLPTSEPRDIAWRYVTAVQTVAVLAARDERYQELSASMPWLKSFATSMQVRFQEYDRLLNGWRLQFRHFSALLP